MIKVYTSKEDDRMIFEAHGERGDILSEYGYAAYELLKHNFKASDVLWAVLFATKKINKEKGEEETDNE